MIRRFVLASVALLSLAPSFAQANLFFTEQPTPSTGAFEWDVFDFLGEIGFAGPHSPDVRSAGIGTAVVTASSIGATFPPPQVTGSNNLYSGNGIGNFGVDLTGAETAGAQTTLVLQVSALGPLNGGSFLLNGTQAPTEFVDRGVGANGANYYWAEWQIAAASSYSIDFAAAGPHLSLSGAQLDYFNGIDVVNAVAAPVFVPEPATGLLAGVGLISLGVAAKRRRQAQSVSL